MAGRKKASTRIGIYYDGYYFYKVSNYYKFDHPRQARISISGLHNFICNEIAVKLDVDITNCKIVEADYFRGRSTKTGNEKAIVGERYFEDALTKEGVNLHYLPLLRGTNNELKEKGIDVSLALTAYKKAAAKAFDVLVLIAGDGDYLPLVRELQTMASAIDVMLLSWDFECSNGEATISSQDLLEEVKYPIQMANVIDDRLNIKNPLILGLFEYRQSEPAEMHTAMPPGLPPGQPPIVSPAIPPVMPPPMAPAMSPPVMPLVASPGFQPPNPVAAHAYVPPPVSPFGVYSSPISPFGTATSQPSAFPSKRRALTEFEMAQERISTILSLNGIGGWIRDLEYNNFYFFYSDVVNKKPEELAPGMTLQFRLKYDRIKTEQKDNGEPSYRAIGPIYAVD